MQIDDMRRITEEIVTRLSSRKELATTTRDSFNMPFTSTRRSPDTVILPYGVNLRVEKTSYFITN